MSINPLPNPAWNLEAAVLALRYILAIARADQAAQELVGQEMIAHPPGVIVRELACIAVDYAHACAGYSYTGAARLIEKRLQDVLDLDEGERV